MATSVHLPYTVPSRVTGRTDVPDLAALLAGHNAAAAALAAADAEAFRQEGPRIDARIGTLLSLVLGALASSGFVGGIGASVSRQRHAYLATGLLAVSALVIVAGLVLIVRLILPRLSRRVTARSGSLARVSVLPDATAVRAHYQSAAQDCLAYQSFEAWRHAAGIARRFRRFRTAGRVLVVGVVLAAAGFLALGWGW
jgi:hypothetical protein